MKQMTYETALTKAWDQLDGLTAVRQSSQGRFLSDTYDVDLAGRRLLSRSCNAAAKDFVSILLLHYLIKRLRGLPALRGQWISFRELAGGESYYSAFYKRAIEPLVRKYGARPQALLEAGARIGAVELKQADACLRLEPFDGVPVVVKLWKGDSEFGPEATMLFDAGINLVFDTEDVAVLGGFIARHL